MSSTDNSNIEIGESDAHTQLPESTAMAGVNAILQSPEALEALGRGLAPALALLVPNAPPSQVSLTHSSQPSRFGTVFPTIAEVPSAPQANVPGSPGYAPRLVSSGTGRAMASSVVQPRMVGSSRSGDPRPVQPGPSLMEEQEETGYWASLLEPVSQTERETLALSDEEDEELTSGSEPQASTPTELSALVTVAFKRPMSSERRKQIVDKFPRPPLPDASPPSLDKAVTTLVQKKKSILAHDRFLMRLQRFASDAVGPITFLLGELIQGRDIPKDKAIAALQAALCCIGNSSAHLSVERRQCILRQLNPKLVPLAEEEFENDGKLFGDDFGRRAKDRMDAIRSLSSSSVFFRLGDPTSGMRFKQGLGGRGKGPAQRFTPYPQRKGKWGRPNPSARFDPKK